MQLPTYKDISIHSPWDMVPGFRLIRNELAQVKMLVNEQLADLIRAKNIDPLLDRVIRRSGKMIRPGFVLLAGACCGRITDEHIKVAAIVEMIHNATLLHDDVIDEGNERRGQPTINSLWGNEYAVLLGDFVLSRVLKMCASLKPQVANIVATTAVRVCEGELRQVMQKQNWQLGETEYIDIITEKAAAFFSGCCRLGAFLANATEIEIESLCCFGLNAGIAFQITDDLLDITGNENQTGKTVGSDVDTNKLTLAVIHLLRVVEETERPLIESMLNAGAQRREALVEMLRCKGSLEYARSRAQESVDRAILALAGVVDNEYKEALIETSKFLAWRKI
jgi:octaprenyl-diphosphate synthase